MAFYARFKEVKFEVMEFETEVERDKWVRFEDEISLSDGDLAEVGSFGRMKLDEKAAMYLIGKYSLVKSEYDIFDYTVYVCPYAPYVNRFPDYWRNTDKDYIGTFLSVFRTDEQTNNEVMKSLNENEYTMTSFCNGGELLVVVPDEDEEGFLRAVKKSAPNAQTKMFDCFIPESGAERRVYYN